MVLVFPCSCKTSVRKTMGKLRIIISKKDKSYLKCTNTSLIEPPDYMQPRTLRRKQFFVSLRSFSGSPSSTLNRMKLVFKFLENLKEPCAYLNCILSAYTSFESALDHPAITVPSLCDMCAAEKPRQELATIDCSTSSCEQQLYNIFRTYH